MKKMTGFAALALACGMMVGCSSSSPDNPVKAWQDSRFHATEIAAKNSAGTPVTLQDVTYVSTLKNPALAAPINALAPISAALYLKAVTNVDEMAAEQDGRLVYIGVQNDIAAGADAAQLLASMPPEDRQAYDAYAAAIRQKDQDSIINNVVLPLLEQVTVESAKVAVVVAGIRENPAFASLAGLEAVMAAKSLAADGSALSSQFSDTTAGLNLWMDLLKKDKEAKAFMAEYPVK